MCMRARARRDATHFADRMRAPDARRAWTCHAIVVAVEVAVALHLYRRWPAACAPPLMEFPATPSPSADTASEPCCGYDVAWPPVQLSALDDAATWSGLDEFGSEVLSHFPVSNKGANASDTTQGRRLVANDFNADFSRRLAFHTWVEEDVALDRRGLERYLRRARAASGLSKEATGGAGPPIHHRPRTAEALQREFGNDFAFEPAFAAQAHHMLSGTPWSQGRDDFMRLVRHGLRPNHYFLSLGCGPLATGHHVMRYLLTGRYHCVEPDEYLLRAAVEFEVPSKGLIHKRARFLLNRPSQVAALMNKPPPWLPTPPSNFDFVIVERPLPSDELERTITAVVRYLRPRSGRLVLHEPLPLRLQRSLGLQPSQQTDLLAGADKRSACPFSTTCSTYAYNT